MSDNGMVALRCGIEDHGDMDRLFEDHRPLTAAFSLWICQGCGVMAVHLEIPGDIYWYNAQAKTRTTDDPGAARVSLMGPVFAGSPETHRAGCAYCPTRFDCSCDSPGQRHMCPRCDAEAEDSKKAGESPTPDAGEVAADRAAIGPRLPGGPNASGDERRVDGRLLMEAITYYQREDVDYGVLALTLGQLRTLRDALEYALGSAVPALDLEGFDIRDEVLAGIQRLEGRGRRAVQP